MIASKKIALDAIVSHPAFSFLPTQLVESIADNVKLFKFKPGSFLIKNNIVPSSVFLVVKGEARILSYHLGKVETISKIGRGSWIGLASLLRAFPSEEICASTDLYVVSFTDESIVNLYQSEAAFSRWCDSQVFDVESLAVAHKIIASNPKDLATLQDIFALAKKQLHPISLESLDQDYGEKLLRTNDIFISSNNLTGFEINQFLPSAQKKLNHSGIFQARLLAIPKDVSNSVASREEKDSDILDNESNLSCFEEGYSTARSSINLVGSGYSSSHFDVKLVKASEHRDQAIACLQMVSQGFNKPFRKDSIERAVYDVCDRDSKISLQHLGQIASSIGFTVSLASADEKNYGQLKVPSIISLNSGFAIILSSNSSGLKLASPRDGIFQLGHDELTHSLGSKLFCLSIEFNGSSDSQPFGLHWFLPVVKRYRASLIQVLATSFVVQIFTIANPLLIQVIIDKVINQRSLDSLQILGLAMIVVAIMEAAMSSIRTLLLTETTNRIDMRLGSEVIDHLLRLPLGFFDRKPVGELSSRIAELEKIRRFITGQALTTILDAFFSIVYIAVLMFYSVNLTFIAFAVVPVQILIVVLGAPLFRRQYRRAASANAKTQSYLVEVLSGIQTVKSQNVEIIGRWNWQDLYSKYIGVNFDKVVTSTSLGEISKLLQRLSQLLILIFGASMVLDGKLSLGQLIAFRIISAYATQPLLRISSIWQSIQELRVSLEQVADIMDTSQESELSDALNIPMPIIEGNVKFDNVTFTFTGNPKDPGIKNINLEISKGTFVGIVGQSGSGKSTLTKLISRLYLPQVGKVLVDNYDVSKVELSSLRRQLGIVPQDPLLFSGTVSDNISLANPDASSDDIVEAAKIAEAHEFIMALPMGYNTLINERGSNLSGGQRQRLAIARTLLGRPKMLILDEATSALDFFTERKVCANLKRYLSGRTVLFITHRLNTIRDSDLIVLMSDGSIAEIGDHSSLLQKRGRYFSLYNQQGSQS